MDGRYELSALYRLDEDRIGTDAILWADTRPDGRLDVSVQRIEIHSVGQPEIVEGPPVPLFNFDPAPSGPRDLQLAQLGTRESFESLASSLLFVLPSFPEAHGSSWQIDRVMPLGNAIDPPPTIGLRYTARARTKCRPPLRGDCVALEVEGATAPTSVSLAGRALHVSYVTHGYATFSTTGVLVSSELALSGEIDGPDGKRALLEGIVTLYHRPRSAGAQHDERFTAGSPIPEGPALIPCPTDASTCPAATACSGEQCSFPRQHPAKHREPNYFIWRAFDAIWAFGRRKIGGRYRCPGAADGIADTGMTPPSSVACPEGVAQRCTPGEAGVAGAYPAEAWQHPTWKALGLEVSMPHQFHFRFKGSEAPSSEGQCQFTVQAFGDLDNDGVYSTFERSGMYDHTGPNAAAGLYIDFEREFE